MRLDSLAVAAFKNLREFTIDFDVKSELPHTVLIGANGTGKSNLLEALLAIFSSLHLKDEKAPFGYKIDYICAGHNVSIKAESQGEYPSYNVDGNAISRPKFKESAQGSNSKYLPKFVFGYYSGASDRFKDYFVEHQRLFYKKLKHPKADPNSLPFRPLFLAKPSHGQFVLLAFYSKEDAKLRKFLEDHLGILDLESVLFVIKQPKWGKNTDDRFWNAAGIPRVLLDSLFTYAIAPIRQSRPVDINYRERPKRINCWNLYLDRAGFQQLADKYDRPQDLFKTLESTDISDLLLELRVTVKVRNVDGSISFRELSEGEQQLLLVLGLLRFTREEEALFLLDEPDTHLNPAWSVQYLKFVQEIVGQQETSHIVMATHDPLVFAGLTKKEVRLMRRDERTNKLFALAPDEEPRGMGVEAILTSDFFGLRAALDLPTLGDLDRKTHLQGIAKRTTLQNQELAEITKRLANLPFARSTGDPLYALFVDEMLKAQEKEQLLIPVLTRAQQERQQQLAGEIVVRLRQERDKANPKGK